MKLLFVLLLSLSPLPGLAGNLDATWWQKIEKEWKPSVVTIQMSWKYYLNTEDEIGSSIATGFLVDADLGLVATNAHVVGANPGKYSLTFFNNYKVRAKLKYLDPWHDFAFLQFDVHDPNIKNLKIKSVVLGSHSELKEGNELALIGNSSGEGLSTKTGSINKLFVNKGENVLARYSHHIHSSLPRAGGASGSPLWNKSGHVVGIHTSGNEQESFELRIDYIQDALEQLRKNETPKRGDLYIRVKTISSSDAESWYGYPSSNIESAPKENVNLHYALIIDKFIDDTAASKKLKIGDIIVGIRNPQEKKNAQSWILAL